MEIEIWSDVVCPWCYIGKRRFEAALAEFEHADDVKVIWRSFELDPDSPQVYPGGIHDMLAQKMGGDTERARQMNAQVTSLAADVGLSYDFDRARPGNTFDAHRLIHLAEKHGLQAEAKERLLRGYFEEGLSVGDHDELAAAIAELGVPEEEARSVLAGDAYAEEVRADVDRARQLGVGGVPFFALAGRYGISGAQPTETFAQALQQAWDETRASADAG